jgi:hypothetical protein
MFLLEMYVHGKGSGCGLVKQMKLGGNLQIIWTMFDCVKRVKDWTTFA